VFSVLAVLGFSAFGIGTFSGSWDTNIKLLPSPSLDYTKLTLKYTDLGFTITSVSTFTGAGFTDQSFSLSGNFGPFEVSGAMYFLPTGTQTISWKCDTQTGEIPITGPKYKSANLQAKLSFGGISITSKVEHWAWPFLLAKSCCGYPTQTPSSYMLYTNTIVLDPFTLVLRFDDCCTGIAFKDLTLDVTGIGLCCGISLDAEFYFTKAGFGYLSFSGIEIPLCCGVSLTAGVTFTTSGKELSTGLKWGGVADTCFTVYGDAIGGEEGTIVEKNPTEWLGIEIYGWKIKCSLGDCNYVEFLTALNPGYFVENKIVAFEKDEFEYMKLGFCGAGCCGGKYTVDLSVFFKSSGLFGISRIGANMSIPVMSNFTVKVAFTSTPTLNVGWVFTF
jgi:hypothetical protein